MPEKILRGIIILLFTVIGVVISNQLNPLFTNLIPDGILTETILGITFISLVNLLLGGVIGTIVGYFVSPYLVSALLGFTDKIEKSLSSLSVSDLIIGTVGLFFGLIIAVLVGLAFASLPYIGPYISVFLAICLGYLGLHLALSKKEEILSFLRIRTDKEDKASSHTQYTDGKLLDTNIIIDGRIADIYQTHFLEGPLIVPVFVLEELQKIADSPDVLKRNRGRRGLDILNYIRKHNKDDIHIVTDDYDDVNEVDTKLVKLAKDKGYKIITNDYNLNKVAEFQGVTVLNINELAAAVKPVVIPGEEIFVQPVKKGKEEGQGVAYLDDGTMIVVENGAKAIGREVLVTITSVLQTTAGKMIFAKLKED